MKIYLLALFCFVGSTFVWAQGFHSSTVSSKNNSTKRTISMIGYFDDNLDFEEWHSDFVSKGLGKVPNGWVMRTGNPNAQKTSNAQNGSYAMHIETGIIKNNVGKDTLVPGYAITISNRIDDYFPPYTKRPVSVTYYLKGNLLGGDSALVNFALMRNNQVVGFAGRKYKPNLINEKWQKFTNNFIYLNDEIPDKISVYIADCSVNIQENKTPATVTKGSYIDFDNMSFEINKGDKKKETRSSHLSIYPNPSSEALNIDYAKGYEAFIYSVNGTVLKYKNITEKHQTIDVSDLPIGTFFIVLKGTKIIERKFTITQ